MGSNRERDDPVCPTRRSQINSGSASTSSNPRPQLRGCSERSQAATQCGSSGKSVPMVVEAVVARDVRGEFEGVTSIRTTGVFGEVGQSIAVVVQAIIAL